MEKQVFAYGSQIHLQHFVHVDRDAELEGVHPPLVHEVTNQNGQERKWRQDRDARKMQRLDWRRQRIMLFEAILQLWQMKLYRRTRL